MAVGSLSARILADASGIKSGLGLTRSELKLTRQAFLDSSSDVDKLNAALGVLDTARGKGAFADEQQYAQAIAQVRSELDPAAIAATRTAAAVDQVNASLREQAATAGMSADEIQRYKLAQQGATQEQIESVAAAQQQVAAAQAQAAAVAQQAAAVRQADAAVERLSASLREQIATQGMSADEIARYKLQQQGATQEQIESVAAMQRQAAAFRQQAAAVEQARQLTAQVDRLADALREEAATAGMSADQIQVWKLRQAGASDAAIQHIQVLQRQRTAAVQAAGGHQALAGGLQGVIAGNAGAIPGVGGLTNVLSAGHPALMAAAAGLAAFAAGLTVVISLGKAFVATVREQFDEVDKLNKSARNLGIDPEALVTLDLAARRAGVETEKLTGAVQKMSRTIGQAELGQGGAAKALDNLGLSARQLAGLRPEQQLATIGEAIRRLPTASQQAAAASAIFGRETKDLMEVLKLTTGEMAAFAQQADSMNLTFDAETGLEVERLNDLMDDLRDTWNGVARDVAISVAPALADAAQQMRDAFADEAVQQSLRDMADAAGVMAGAVRLLSAEMSGFTENAATWGPGTRTYLELFFSDEQIDQATAYVTKQRKIEAQREKDLAEFLKNTSNLLKGGKPASPAADIAPPEIEDTGIPALTQTMDALREQAETYGMNAERIALYRAAKSGASAEDLAEMRRLQEEIRLRREASAAFDAAAAAAADAESSAFKVEVSPETKEAIAWLEETRKQQESLAKSLDETTRRYQEQAATAGMTAEQIELYRLQQQGATPEQLAQVEGLQQQAAAAKAAADQTAGLADATDRLAGVNAALGGSAEAAEAIQRFRAQAGAGAVAVAADLAPPPLAVTLASPPPATGSAPAEDRLGVALDRVAELLQEIAANTGRPAVELDVEEVSA
jgi:hypothetical protein